MIVESEPNGFLMVRYKLYFNQLAPDPEDAWVLAYLDEHGLQPRRQLDEKHQGISYKVLHFGQCYLKRHVHQLGELYQRGVEFTALQHHIHGVLDAAGDAAVRSAWGGLDATACQGVVVTLSEQLHEQAQFAMSDQHELLVTIEATAVVNAFVALQSTV